MTLHDYRETEERIGRGNVDYARFSAALKKMNIESSPYPIDLQVRIIRVERDGSSKNIEWANTDRPSRLQPIEFQFSIGAGVIHLLIVDDEWYWKQHISDSLRGKMAKYVNIRNTYFTEMEKLGRDIREKKQYKIAEGIALRDGIINKYRKMLCDAISEFMGKKIELPPDCVRPMQIEVETTGRKRRPYRPLHDEDDEIMSKLDMLSYGLLEKRNRFEEYEKEIERQEEMDRAARREELRLKGSGEFNGSREAGVSGRDCDGRKEKLRLKGPTRIGR